MEKQTVVLRLRKNKKLERENSLLDEGNPRTLECVICLESNIGLVFLR